MSDPAAVAARKAKFDAVQGELNRLFSERFEVKNGRPSLLTKFSMDAVFTLSVEEVPAYLDKKWVDDSSASHFGVPPGEAPLVVTNDMHETHEQSMGTFKVLRDPTVFQVLESFERKYAARARVVRGVKVPTDSANIMDDVDGIKLGERVLCHIQVMAVVGNDQEGSIAQEVCGGGLGDY